MKKSKRGMEACACVEAELSFNTHRVSSLYSLAYEHTFAVPRRHPRTRTPRGLGIVRKKSKSIHVWKMRMRTRFLRTAPPIAALGTHSEIAWHFPGLDCSCSCVLPPLNTTASQNASAWPQRHANHTRHTCDALGALGAPVALACGCECGSASVPRCRGSELAQGATWAPSQSPTASPTVSPTSPTAVPTRSPTYRGVTLAPTASPTAAPSRTVTTSPTSSPSPRRSAVLSLRERIACCTADDHALAKKQARSRILELPRKQARCTHTKSARHGGALSLPADVAWCARLCLRFFYTPPPPADRDELQQPERVAVQARGPSPRLC